jgi:hypothetical protein
MTYTCPTCGYAVETDLLNLQRLQNRVFCTIENLDRCTPVCRLYMAFKIPYVHDYITKLCRTQEEVIINNVNPNVYGIGQGEVMHW